MGEEKGNGGMVNLGLAGAGWVSVIATCMCLCTASEPRDLEITNVASDRKITLLNRGEEEREGHCTKYFHCALSLLLGLTAEEGKGRRGAGVGVVFQTGMAPEIESFTAGRGCLCRRSLRSVAACGESA